MTTAEAVEILKQFNLWRRDREMPNSQEMPDPKKIGIAIDMLTDALDISKVSRLEVISYENGREYVNWNKEWTLGIEESLQDDGRTLKIFINK